MHHSLMPVKRATLRATRSPATCTSFATTRLCRLPPDSSCTTLPPPQLLLLLPGALQDRWQRRLLLLMLLVTLSPPVLPPQQHPQDEQQTENDATSLPAVLPAALDAHPGVLPPQADPAAAAAYARRSCRAGSDRTVVMPLGVSAAAAPSSSAVRGWEGSRATTLWLSTGPNSPTGCCWAHSLKGWLFRRAKLLPAKALPDAAPPPTPAVPAEGAAEGPSSISVRGALLILL